MAAQTFAQCRHCGATNPAVNLYCSHCGGTLLSPSQLLSPPRFTMIDGEVAAVRPRANAPAAPEPKPTQEAPSPSQGLIPTHELLKMASTMGIEINYNTLRFWQKRGLVSRPLRGPVESGRGTRGYYDASLLERLGFVREVQKTYSMGLDTIREELAQIDRQIAQTGDPARAYRERLTVLQAQRETESRRTLLSVLSRVMGVPADEIATVVIRKKDGQTLRLYADRSGREPSADAAASEIARLFEEEKKEPREKELKKAS